MGEIPNFERLKKIVENRVPEGLSLEFKSIDLFIDRQPLPISKAVSAFANSVGGALIFGIVPSVINGQKDSEQFKLLGDSSGKDYSGWLQVMINSHTSPAVVNYEVHSINSPAGERFYWVAVGRSPLAPHQAADKKYYKRNGSNSIPMEHFEIEDIRSRALVPSLPLDVDLEIDQQVMTTLVMRNAGDRVLKDCRFEVISELNLDKSLVDRLKSSGLRYLRRGRPARFHLGNLLNLLKEPSSAISIKFEYVLNGATIKDEADFDIQDFRQQLAHKGAEVRELEKIWRSIDKLTDRLEKLDDALANISGAYSSSGLHLADSSLKELTGDSFSKARRYDFRKVDEEGLRDVLGVSIEQAQILLQKFRYEEDSEISEYVKTLSPELRQRLTERFDLSF